jgi:hypothetical protein
MQRKYSILLWFESCIFLDNESAETIVKSVLTKVSEIEEA